MDSIRKEIEAELRRARLDKGRLYDLILKIVDSGVGGGAGSPGPAGPPGPVGPAGVCKCSQDEKPVKAATPKEDAKPVKAATPKEDAKPVKAAAPAPIEDDKPSAKKVVTKKKTGGSA